MQIKYLKDAPLAKAGETAEVTDDQAKILITLGYAKEQKAKIGTAKTDTAKADNLTPTTPDLLTENE